MASREPGKYIRETEHAVRHLFRGIEECEQLVRGLPSPFELRSVDEVNRSLEAARAYFDRYFSEATLCGAILQVAFMGIFLFSTNKIIPADCTKFVNTERHKAVRFCIGRRVHEIPVGLLIYAARNQFNHWDDEYFDYPTTQVFAALLAAYINNPLFDLAYELNFPGRTLKANHIVLNELRWTSYEAYAKDMLVLLEANDAL